MKLTCKSCGSLVLEGTIEGEHRRFIPKSSAEEGVMKPKGQIFRNHSQDAHNWTALCSKCQKENHEKTSS